MEMPWLSLTGLYNYDSTILDNLQLPTAADYAAFAADYPDMIVSDPFVPDKTALVNYMLFALAELPLVYSDPAFIKQMIGYWSAVKAPVFKQIYRTLLYKYNPIWNKDGKITEERDVNFENNGRSSDSGTVGRNGASSGSAEHQVTGFDTNAYSPDKKDITSGSANETETRDLSGTANNSGRSEDRFTRTEQGNIGVTTTQQMIREQREIAGFNFYEYVTNEFKKEFCVAVW